MKMRTLNLLLTAILAAPGLASAMSSRQAGDILAAVTNAATQPAVTNVAPAPAPAPAQPAQAPSTELVAAGDFYRPAIAMGKNGMIAVAAEGPRLGSVHLYTLPAGAKKWTGGVVMQTQRGGTLNCSRIYVPDVAVDSDGWTFVTARCGPKEWGTLHGPAAWIQDPKGKGALYVINFTIGAARLGLEPGKPGAAIVMSKNGTWARLERSGRLAQVSTFPAGLTGEKFAFAITPAGTWHTAHNGSALQASAYAWGTAAGGRRITWADDKTYPDMANDLNYPSLLVTEDGVAWCASVLSGRLRVQRISPAGALRWPATALGDMGPAKHGDRCPPRLAVAGGRLLAVWEAPGGTITRTDVLLALKGKAAPKVVCQGTQPAVCSDAAGRLHMVYIQAGALRYRAL